MKCFSHTESEAVGHCVSCGHGVCQVCLNNGKMYCDSCASKGVTLPKIRVTASLLALLLGGLGIHKFYLNKIGQGIVYLLFSWTGIPMIIGLVEGIIYLRKSDEEFQRDYIGK